MAFQGSGVSAARAAWSAGADRGHSPAAFLCRLYSSPSVMRSDGPKWPKTCSRPAVNFLQSVGRSLVAAMLTSQNMSGLTPRLGAPVTCLTLSMVVRGN